MPLRSIKVRGVTWNEVIIQFDDLLWINYVRTINRFAYAMFIFGTLSLLLGAQDITQTFGILYGVVFIILSALFFYIEDFLPENIIKREVQKGLIGVNGKKFITTADTEIKVRIGRNYTVEITNVLPAVDEEIESVAYI